MTIATLRGKRKKLTRECCHFFLFLYITSHPFTYPLLVNQVFLLNYMENYTFNSHIAFEFSRILSLKRY